MARALRSLFGALAGLGVACALLLPVTARAEDESGAAAAPESKGTPREEAALAALAERKLVRARELAENVLRDDPASFRGEYVLGVALHDAEGNVPLALRHFQQALARTTGPDGRALPGMRTWFGRILQRKISALSDLGRYDELLAALRDFRREFGDMGHSLDVWPLMKLGQLERARAAATRAIASGSRIEEAQARNGLCALDGYPACAKMLEVVRQAGLDQVGLALRNAAVSAQETGRYSEAEKLLLESTEYPEETTNPWRDLASLYATQGRLGEALDASRRMLAFSRLLPPRARQHGAAEDLVTAGQLLLLAGHAERAAAASDRALAAPDRAAHWSGSAQELTAEGQLLDRAVHRTLAEHEREVGAIAAWYEAPLHWWRALVHRMAAWLSGRRLQPLLEEGGLRPADPRVPLRPELAAPGWLLPDAVGLFGPGPTLALLADSRNRGPSADDNVPAALREAERLAVESEAHWLRGAYEECLASGARARAAMPAAEALWRARVALRMAQSALALGRRDEAWPLFDEVLAKDPGAFRRLGVALPVALATADGPADAAARRALASPRFTRDPGSPFRLAAQDRRLCLLAARGSVLACASDPGPRPEVAPGPPWDRTAAAPRVAFDPQDLPRPEQRLALAFVNAAFAPRVDLSQQDLSTLDGTPVAERGLDASQIDPLLGR